MERPRKRRAQYGGPHVHDEARCVNESTVTNTVSTCLVAVIDLIPACSIHFPSADNDDIVAGLNGQEMSHDLGVALGNSTDDKKSGEGTNGDEKAPNRINSTDTSSQQAKGRSIDDRLTVAKDHLKTASKRVSSLQKAKQLHQQLAAKLDAAKEGKELANKAETTAKKQVDALQKAQDKVERSAGDDADSEKVTSQGYQHVC